MLNLTFSLFLMHLFKMLFNPINNHLTCDHIFTTDRNDDVGISLAGLNECLVHGLYSRKVLIYNLVEISSSLLNVTRESTENSNVRIGIHEDLHIKSIA